MRKGAVSTVTSPFLEKPFEKVEVYIEKSLEKVAVHPKKSFEKYRLYDPSYIVVGKNKSRCFK